MIRCGVFFSFVLSCGISAYGGDSFFVFAPDRKNKQVLCASVRSSAEGVSASLNEPLGLPFGPTSAAVHPNGKHLFLTAAGKEASPVATVEILEDGALRLLEASSLEQPSGYTSIDRNGRFFLTANYGSGAITVYPITENAKLGDPVCSVKTPRTEAHCILTTCDNRFVYVPCVKRNNAVYQFSFDQQSGRLVPLEPFNALPPAMFGPRHVAYHPTLPIAYFSNEQQLGVSVYAMSADGQLQDIQHAVSMPRRSPFVQGKRDLHASDIVVSSDGKRLFVAVRDFAGDEDSVFAFRVEVDGRLSQIGRTKVGDIPWKLDLSPDGNFLLVSEAFDGHLAILKIQPNGRLSKAAQVDWDAEVRDMVVVRPR